MYEYGEIDDGLDLSAVPLFPLPNVVLFPRAVLPLHIFEERYKQMTADAIAGDGRLAMALLEPGWEKCYYARPAIEPVVCVGEILSHEKLADGRYNFLLRGTVRARIVEEHPTAESWSYRVARLERLQEFGGLEIDLEDQRQRLVEMFTRGPLARASLGKEIRQMLEGDWKWNTSAIADMIAFHLLEELPLKQSLLAEPNVRERVAPTVRALAESAHAATAETFGSLHGPSGDLN